MPSSDQLVQNLFAEIAPSEDGRFPHNRVTVVGVGKVGMACAYSILQQDIANEICLIDTESDKLRAEMMDLQHGLSFLKHRCVVKAGTDFGITAGSKVYIIAAGCRQERHKTRMDYLLDNVEIFKDVVPRIMEHSPGTCLLVVSNPVDVMTYVAWKLSGLPQERVFGSGTNLDSARLRFLLSEKLNIAPANCHAWIIGEHGENCAAVWSGVNVGGTKVGGDTATGDTGGDNPHDDWQSTMLQRVVDSANEIVHLKGYTSWAIGLSITSIVSALLKNSRNVFALSTNVKGLHGVTNDVFLSLPAVVGANGLTHVVQQHLDTEERAKFQVSARKFHDVQESLHL